MSTAIMHSGPFYDFGDLILKNQPSSRTQNTITAVNNQLHLNNAQALNQQNHHNNLQQTTNSMISIQQTINNSSTVAPPPPVPHHHQQQQHQHHHHHNTQQQQSQQQQHSTTTTPVTTTQGTTQTSSNKDAAAAAAITTQQQLQQHMNVAQALTAAQQQQQKMLLHSALTRAVSHPVGGQQAVQLLNSINEILGHKKLERTQSEPLPQLNTSRYKTELCRPFEEAGECKYGDKCQFAHGVQELRNLQRHPKYKTELCRTFHSVGFCPYGPRCHFVHNAEEARTHNRNVDAYHARLAAANMHTNSIPLSPPLSMSTGSDRASPTGSLSLSPTNSMINFFAGDNVPPQQQQQQQPQQQQSPQQTQHHHQQQQQSPTASFGSNPSAGQQPTFVFPISPPASPTGSSPLASTPPPTTAHGVEEARLPVFNRLSSTVADAFGNLQI